MDEVEQVAKELHDAFYTDTRNPAEWPPSDNRKLKAWRRAAAQAIDLGAHL